jgi:LAO/AO transport system kinase
VSDEAAQGPGNQARSQDASGSRISRGSPSPVPSPSSIPLGQSLGKRLRERDLSAAPAALNLLESSTTVDREQAALLLREVSPAALGGEAQGHIVGVTGPPGAGKSTLLSALLHTWREQPEESATQRAGSREPARQRKSVAMLAVDPSSKRSGGSLLGDRARIDFDPADRGVLIRSTAAGERLGGLAAATRAAAQALAAAFDVVVIETVGVGQAETEVADVADTVVVVVQPGSGDVLQFLKSGIMETPDVLVVTKADLGQIALATRRDLSAALRSLGTRATRVLSVSSVPPPQGIDELIGVLEEQRSSTDIAARRLRARRKGALLDFATEYGERGLRALGGRPAAERLLEREDAGLDAQALLFCLERAAERAGGS